MKNENYTHIILTLFLAVMVVTMSNAQVLTTAKPDKTPVGKKVKVEPSYAWSISEPLGLHYESTIDTLLLNYHKQWVPSMQSNAWATTGNFGSSGQNQIFFERKSTSDFFFEDAIDNWLPSVSTQRYYNTRIPMTLIFHPLSYSYYSVERGESGSKM